MCYYIPIKNERISFVWSYLGLLLFCFNLAFTSIQFWMYANTFPFPYMMFYSLMKMNMVGMITGIGVGFSVGCIFGFTDPLSSQQHYKSYGSIPSTSEGPVLNYA